MTQPEPIPSPMANEGLVVFLIGARVNRWWRIHSWWPVVRAMPRMIAELEAHPELGLLGHQQLGLASMVQYWNSKRQLLDYARSAASEHLPAWREFNLHVRKTADVGIWHEAYAVERGAYSTMYVNMPTMGLGKTGLLSGRSLPETRVQAA